MFLFLLPFACGGLATTTTSYNKLCSWLVVQSWSEVPATISELELKEHNDDDGTFYEIQGQFSYSVDGVIYRSRRISHDEDSDNFSSWQSKNYRRLQPLIGVQNAVPCYVDLSEPTEAILLRDARWELLAFLSIFNALFGTIGVLGVLLTIVGWRESREIESLKSRFSNQPWRWKTCWEENTITSSQSSRSFWFKAFSVWWLIAVIPSTVVSIAAIYSGSPWALLGLIPFAMTLVIVWFAFRHHRMMSLMGEATLRMPDAYIQPGVGISAACVFPVSTRPTGPLTAKLTRRDTISTGDGTSFKVGWEHECSIPAEECEIVAEKLCAAIPIELPADSPESDIAGDGSTWAMTVNVPTEFGPHSVYFELPVFRGARNEH